MSLRSRLPRPARGHVGLAVLSGLVSALAFPPLPLWALAFVGPVPLLLALRSLAGRRGDPPRGGLGQALVLGYVAGLAYFLGTMWWIAFVRSPFVTIPWLLPVSMVAAVLYVGLFWALLAGLVYAAFRWLRIPPEIAAPALWVASDYLRSLSEMAFPWSYLGSALAASLPLLQMASLLGVWTLTAHAVLTSVLFLRMVELRAGWRRRGAGAWALLLLLGPYFWGLAILGRPSPRGELYVGAVQPNVDMFTKWSAETRDQTYDLLVARSREVERERPDLLVWPETALPCYPSADAACARWISGVALEAGTYLLFGHPDRADAEDGGRTYRNAVTLADPRGRFLASYAKRHLVPFSERLPWEDRIPGLDRVELGQADFSPGNDWTIFEVGGKRRFGAVVCYEITFPAACRELVRRGAQFLVNVTNDAWFGKTSAPYQHAQMAQVRAVETRVWVVRSANTGVSLFADPRGRVVQSLPLGTAGGLLQEIAMREETSLYLRVGDVLPRACLGFAAAVAALAAVRARREKRARA